MQCPIHQEVADGRHLSLQGKATWLQLLKNWFFSFFGNLAGSLFIVWLVDETYLFQTGALAGVANAKAVAVSKTSADFGTTVVRGLLCNWLVRFCSTTRTRNSSLLLIVCTFLFGVHV